MKIKSIAFLVLAVSLVALLSACQEEQRALPADVQQVSADFWQIDLDAALEQAKAENRHAFVYVTGSAWCRWCIQLKNEVLTQPEFLAYAQDNLIGVVLDFDRTGRAVEQEFAEQHERALQRYQVQGFPTVLIFNPQGTVIERTGYRRGGAAAYVEHLREILASE